MNNLVIVSSQPLLSHCLSIYLSFLISLTLLVLPHLTVCLFLSLLLSLPFISLSNYLLGPTYPPYPTMCVCVASRLFPLCLSSISPHIYLLSPHPPPPYSYEPPACLSLSQTHHSLSLFILKFPGNRFRVYIAFFSHHTFFLTSPIVFSGCLSLCSLFLKSPYELMSYVNCFLLCLSQPTVLIV